MTRLWQDVRYGPRSLLRNRDFVVAGVVVLAIGVGINTAVFSLVNAVLFRPLAARAPEELRYIHALETTTGQIWGMSLAAFDELRAQRDVFVDVLARASDMTRLSIGGELVQLGGELVSGNYFEVLGVRPILGRTFIPADVDAPNGRPEVVISHGLWQRQFNGDPDIIGRSFEFHRSTTMGYYSPGRRYTVIGVMPPQFKGTKGPWEETPYWVPVAQRSAEIERDGRGRVSVMAIGRVKPGIATTQAQAFIATLGARLQRVFYPTTPGWTLVLRESQRAGGVPFDSSRTVVSTNLAIALLTVSGIVLLIASSNVIGILMARGIRRRGEIAVCLTLGAPRWRLMRQLWIESLILSVVSSAFGLLLSRILIGAFLANLPADFGRLQLGARVSIALDVPLDVRVLLFTLAVCVTVAFVVGLAPVMQARKADLVGPLSGSSVEAPRSGSRRVRHAMLVPQIALSLVLLLVAGSLVSTLLRAELIDPGYEAERMVLLDFDQLRPTNRPMTGEEGWRLTEARKAFHRRIQDNVAAIPDVHAFALTFSLPWSRMAGMSDWLIARDEYLRGERQSRGVTLLTVTNGYFAAMETPIVRGRGFDDRDGPTGVPVAVISETLARWLWPGQDPIGRAVASYPPDSPRVPEWREVIGVARDVVPVFNETAPRPLVYMPLEQRREAWATTVIARGRGNPSVLLDRVKQAVIKADPTAAVSRLRTAQDAIAEVLYPRRAAATGLLGCGLIGLLLASLGLYGVVSYSVAQRVREIGIRCALGAQRADIARLVLFEGVTVTLIGVGLGLVLAYAAIKIVSSYVVAIPALDVITMVGVPLILSAIVLLACAIPARRASRVDPIVVLRAL